MKNLIRACIALAAFAALFVVPSVASALVLTNPTGTAASVGVPIQATNVAHSNTAKHVLFTTASGNITCEVMTLTGTLHTNGPATITGDVTTVEARNAATAACSGPFGATTITPNHTSNPSHNGASSLPWCTTTEPEDKITIRGGKCTEAARPLIWAFHSASTGTCTYQKESMVATFTTHPAAAIATVASQTFTKVTGGAFCPSSGSLDMAFTFETDPKEGSPVDVYIDP